MPSTDEAPVWLQQVIGAAAFLGTAGAAIWAGRKSKGESAGQATVLAGAIADGRQINRVIDALDEVTAEMRESREQRHRDSLNERECIERLAGAVHQNTEAQRSSSGLTPEFMALLAKLKS
jgi:hypothetical protein